MSPGRFLQRYLILAVTSALIVAHDVEIVRPAFLNWGATAEARQSALPGDDIVKGAATQQTRAIAIDAPVQALQDRLWMYPSTKPQGGTT